LNTFEHSDESRSAQADASASSRRPWVRRKLSGRRNRWIAGAATLAAVTALIAGCTTSTSGTTTPTTAPATTPATPAHPGPPGGGAAGGGSNARSGAAAGGSAGTVDTVSTATFTLTTPAGQLVTVHTAASTTYLKGTTPAAASDVAKGESVLVLGTTSSTTITATQVVVQPTGASAADSSAAGVVPFKRGAPSAAKSIGAVPANYTEGSGTIVSGTVANKATEAALAAYPGGVVDRVVKLSNGEYEVHYIGVNWPHHIFVDQSFKVVGAF
jgi:hypothetical protein